MDGLLFTSANNKYCLCAGFFLLLHGLVFRHFRRCHMCRITEQLKFQGPICHLEQILPRLLHRILKIFLTIKRAVRLSAPQSFKFSYCITDLKRRYSITASSIYVEGQEEEKKLWLQCFHFR